jgi:hypothetical protein
LLQQAEPQAALVSDRRPGQPSAVQHSQLQSEQAHDPLSQHPQQAQEPQPIPDMSPMPTGTSDVIASADHKAIVFITKSPRV